MADTGRLNDDERDELVAYLDGELDPAAAQHMESRLKSDPRLRVEADAYQQTWALLDGLPQTESSPTFASRTLEKLSAVDSPRTTGTAARRLLQAWWAAGALAAAAVGYAAIPAPSRVVDLDRDPMYRADPKLIENLPLYLAVENIEFLRLLDADDLFGEDGTGR